MLTALDVRNALPSVETSTFQISLQVTLLNKYNTLDRLSLPCMLGTRISYLPSKSGKASPVSLGMCICAASVINKKLCTITSTVVAYVNNWCL